MHAPITRTVRTLVSALVATAHLPTPPRKRGSKLTPLLALALLGPALAGCRPTADRSEGVELVLSSSAPTPTMTFELRFDEAMVGDGQVGVPVTNSPLVITPPLAGAFTWLNTRSGTFTPSEPLALDTRYDLRLRPGLRCADGRPAKAVLDRTLTTPPFDLIAFLPRHPDTNATSEPEVKLAFNADIRASEAERFLYFRDEIGRRIPADVRQATVEEIDYPTGQPLFPAHLETPIHYGQGRQLVRPRERRGRQPDQPSGRTCSSPRHVRPCRWATAGAWWSQQELPRRTARCVCGRAQKCR